MQHQISFFVVKIGDNIPTAVVFKSVYDIAAKLLQGR